MRNYLHLYVIWYIFNYNIYIEIHMEGIKAVPSKIYYFVAAIMDMLDLADLDIFDGVQDFISS